jgi:hypothetical protein
MVRQGDIKKNLIVYTICFGFITQATALAIPTTKPQTMLKELTANAGIVHELNQAPTQQEIEQQIAAIKKTIQSINTINILATSLTAGIGGIAVAATTVTALALLVISPFFPAFVPLGATGIAAASSSVVLTYGIITLIVAGLLGTASGATVLSLFGGLSAASLITAVNEAKKLALIDQHYPNLLTQAQKTTLSQFDTLLKGKLGHAITQGIQLRNIKNDVTNMLIAQSPALVKALGGKLEKTQSFIQKYITKALQLHNIKLTYAEYQKQKTALQTERIPYKKLSQKHIALDLKIAALDLRYGTLNTKIKSLEKELTNMKQQAKDSVIMLEQHAQIFIQQTEKRMAEFSTAVKK